MPDDLLVLDTMMSFLPSSQNDLVRLQMVRGPEADRRYPAGVLILHQACTARGRAGALRVRGALADILIDMSAPSADLASRRRRFSGVGRDPGTLQNVEGELNAEGTDYVQVAEATPIQGLGPSLETLRGLLSQSEGPLTRQEILERWPAAGVPPRADSLGRCLMHACEQGILTRSGAGTKAEAFRYELAL